VSERKTETKVLANTEGQ